MCSPTTEKTLEEKLNSAGWTLNLCVFRKKLPREQIELPICILFVFLIVICPFSKHELIPFTDKLKRKKEKLCDRASEDISNCLAMLSLQSSSAPHPQLAPPVISKKDEPVLVGNPLGQEWNSNKDRSGISHHQNTPASRAPAATTASPSDSALINALHLSNIDWDAVSFTSSPPVHSSVGHTAETKPIAEMQNTSSDSQEAASRCAAQMCYTELSLRDRLLIKNMAKAGGQLEGRKDTVSKELNSKLSSVTHSSCPNTHEEDPTNLNRIEPLSDKIHYPSNRQDSDTPMAKHGNGPAAQPSSKSTNKHGGSQMSQKYKFAKKPVSSSVAMSQKQSSDPSQSRKNTARIKNSICVSIVLSSEESDTETQEFRPRVKARIKPMTKIKANLHSDVALKPISAPKPPSKSALPAQLPGPKPQSCSLEINRNIVAAWDQNVSLVKVNSTACLQNAASPVAVSDSDDSVICRESPLPLAERLRLKFLKWGLYGRLRKLSLFTSKDNWLHISLSKNSKMSVLLPQIFICT